MYVLDSSEFASLDRRSVTTFIRYWSQFHRDGPKKLGTDNTIDYETELNLGAKLSRENIKNLLRWKAPRHLTHVTLSGKNCGQSNAKVARVLAKQISLNRFRNGEIGESAMRDSLDKIFPTGIVYRVFVLHICKPLVFPIADQHVFRAFRYHTNRDLSDSWEKYDRYKEYFFSLASHLPTHKCPSKQLQELKMLDSALMMFGQFLDTYGRTT